MLLTTFQYLQINETKYSFIIFWVYVYIKPIKGQLKTSGKGDSLALIRLHYNLILKAMKIDRVIEFFRGKEPVMHS